MIKVTATPHILLLMLVFLPLFFFVSGCAIKGPVSEDKRIALQEKSNGTETYARGPLTVDYEYKRAGDSLTMSGSIGFNRGLDSLDVRVLFLDGAGMILDRKLVYSSGYRSLAARESTRTFRRTVDIPPGATAFTFDETARERTSMR